MTKAPDVGVMASKPQVDQYMAGDRIVCLICGKPFRSVGRHVHLKHGITARAYKIRFGLPVSRGLDVQEVRQRHSAAMSKTWAEGKLAAPDPPPRTPKALCSPLPAYTKHMPRHDPRFAERLFEGLRAGHTITSACRQDGMPTWSWVHARLQIDAALRARFDAVVESLPFAQQARMKKLGARFSAAVAERRALGWTAERIGQDLGVSEEAVRREVVRQRPRCSADA